MGSSPTSPTIFKSQLKGEFPVARKKRCKLCKRVYSIDIPICDCGGALETFFEDDDPDLFEDWDDTYDY